MAIPINAAAAAYSNAAKLMNQALKKAWSFIRSPPTAEGRISASLSSERLRQGVVDFGKVSDVKSMDLVKRQGRMWSMW